MAEVPKDKSDELSEAEAQQRFEQALKAGLNTPPAPLKKDKPKGSKRAPRRT